MDQTPSEYSLAFSSCPNDTFIFKAIARKLIPLNGYQFTISLEDVETLNKSAQNLEYDVTKLSFATLGNLLDKYALLRSGSALGKGCGPLIISNPLRALDDIKEPVIAVPGMGTTAFYLFQFFLKDKFPELTPQFLPMTFENVMPAVRENKADFGLIIHESRFVYPSFGLELKADLGKWWEETTGLPIPLGCIAVRRDLDPATALDFEKLIRQSIVHAFEHPEAEFDYIQSHAQEMDPSVMQQHIDLYVNRFSEDIGEDGETAIQTFFQYARNTGLMAPCKLPLFNT